MRPTTSRLAAAVTLCCWLAFFEIPSFAQEKNREELSKLSALRSDLQLKLDKLQEPISELDVNYRRYLEEQKTSYQQKGLLKEMLAVDEELNTFQTTPAKELSPYSELQRLQQIYREQRKSREDALVAPRQALIEKYQGIAETLASDWTRAGKIEAAKQALAEAERFAAKEKETTPNAEAEAMRPLGEDREEDLLGQEAGEEMKNSVGMNLCWIPAGTFTMGSPANEDGHNPRQEAQVEVRLTSGYWMGKYEVTREEYEEVTGTNPSAFSIKGGRGPVEKLSWQEAVSFCETLTEQERDALPDGWAYQLPTEAQWEYACRAGEEGPFSGGDIDDVGWIKANAGDSSHDVGEKKPNAWGLHDMHGNVREWCHDWMTGKLEGGNNPQGPDSGTGRVVRGGCWNYPFRAARAGQRNGMPPGEKVYDLGFRISLGPARN